MSRAYAVRLSVLGSDVFPGSADSCCLQRNSSLRSKFQRRRPHPAQNCFGASQGTEGDPSLRTHTKPVKVDVNLVLVPVTITDPMNRLVTGLDRDNFNLFEGKDQQVIKTFSSEDAPISLGVIFDMSGSMGSKIERAREAVIEFFKTANPQDEFFMITFAEKPEEISDFTSSVEDIQGKLVTPSPKAAPRCSTPSIWASAKCARPSIRKRPCSSSPTAETTTAAIPRARSAPWSRKPTSLSMRSASTTIILPTDEERLGPGLLSDITELTGGRAFTIDNPNDLADVSTKIGIELRNQYVLGYRPKNPGHDGKWRKIKVKLIPPKGLPPLRVYAKTGYYAPTE